MSLTWSLVMFAVFGVLAMLPAVLMLRRASTSAREFVGASQKVAPYMVMGSIWGHWIWLGGLLGAGEGGYLFGLPAAWAYPLGWLLSIIIFVPLIKRLRNILPGATTHVQFMRLRFGRKNHVLYAIGSIGILFASLIVNLVGVGIAFEAIGHVPYWVTLTVGGGIIIGYVTLSGMWAVNVTGLIQTFFLAIFALIVVPVVIFRAGGPSHIVSGLADQGLPQFAHVVNSEFLMAFLVPMTLSYIFFAQTDPSVWQKAFSVSYRRLGRALILGVAAAAALDASVAMIGVTGKALLPNPVASYNAVPETIAYFAPGLVWVFLVMCLCAMLATCSALLNACSAYLTVDVVGEVLPHLSDTTSRHVARWLTVIVGVACIVAGIALHSMSLLGLIVILGVVISVFAIPVTLGIFWSKANRNGVFVGTLAGVVASFVMWQWVYGGMWSANLWKILLINYAITFTIPVVWSLASPEAFDYASLKKHKLFGHVEQSVEDPMLVPVIGDEHLSPQEA